MTTFPEFDLDHGFLAPQFPASSLDSLSVGARVSSQPEGLAHDPSFITSWEMSPTESPLGPPSGMMMPRGTPMLPPQVKMPSQGAYVSHYPGPPIQTSKNCQGPEGCNLFIFHIPNDLSNMDLYNLFLPFGNVISARIMVENETGRSRGFGFVSFDNRTSADSAIKAMNGYQIGRKRLKVQHKKERHDNQTFSNIGPTPQMGFVAPHYQAMPPGTMMHPYYMSRPPMSSTPQQVGPQRRPRRREKTGPLAHVPARPYGDEVDPSSLLLESALSSLTLDEFGSNLSQSNSDGSHEAPFDPWANSPSPFVPSAPEGLYEFPHQEHHQGSQVFFDAPVISPQEKQILELQKRIKEQTVFAAARTKRAATAPA